MARTLTVWELVKALSEFDPQTRVDIRLPGDYRMDFTVSADSYSVRLDADITADLLADEYKSEATA